MIFFITLLIVYASMDDSFCAIVLYDYRVDQYYKYLVELKESMKLATGLSRCRSTSD